MKLILATLLFSASLSASQDLNESAKSNQQAIDALKQSFGIAQAQINKECVQPTQDLMCNAATGTTTNMLTSVFGQIVSSAVGGVGGQAISTGIGGISCMLIKCDTTTSRNDACNGSETTSVCNCPPQPVTSTANPAPCKSGGQAKTARDICQGQSTCCSFPEASYIATVPGCKTAYQGSSLNCSTAIQLCDGYKNIDDGTVDNGYEGSDAYKTCITSYKTKAKERQTKCRSICNSMVALLGAFNATQLGAAPSLQTLQNQTTTQGGSGSSTNTNTNANTNTNTNANANNNTTTAKSSGSVDKSTSVFDPRLKGDSASSGVGDTGTGVGSSTGASSSSAKSSYGSSQASDGNSNGVGSAIASIGTNGSNSSDSNELGAGKKLKGLKKVKAENEYLASSEDLFLKISAIYSSNYLAGVIGINKVGR